MIINTIFPTPVAFFKYEEGLSAETMDFLTNQKLVPNGGNYRSEDTYILKHKCLENLTAYIEKCIDEYFKTIYNPSTDVELRLTQSWLNYSNTNQWHHIHAHPSSFISGCYYVNANPLTDMIHFQKSGYRLIEFMPKEWNLYNSESWSFPVCTGDIVLFPSDLQHKVEPVQGSETRISLAFNTFPVGHFGDKDSLTEIYLK